MAPADVDTGPEDDPITGTSPVELARYIVDVHHDYVRLENNVLFPALTRPGRVPERDGSLSGRPGMRRGWGRELRSQRPA